MESSFEELGNKGDPVLEILAGVFCGGIVSKYHLSRWKASFWVGHFLMEIVDFGVQKTLNYVIFDGFWSIINTETWVYIRQE